MSPRFAVKSALLIFSAYLVFGLLQAPSYLKIDPETTIWESITSVVIFSGIILPAAYWGARIDPESLPILSGLLGREAPDRRRWLVSLSYGLVLAAIAFLINISLSLAFTEFWAAPTSQDYILDFSILDKVAVAISSGIWEETIFRFFLISALVPLIRSRIGSALVANSLFTVMHVVLQDPPYNLPALTVVFVIGLVYTKCFLDRGVGSAATCHAGMNLLSMILGPGM